MSTLVQRSRRPLLLDHTQAPLVDGIREYRELDILPFTTPGHKRGASIPAATSEALGWDVFHNDISVGAGVDDTHFTRDLVGRAERLAADAYGADRSLFLLNGSSIGNHVGILSLVGPGDKIVVARNVHKSILSALILSGARPVYVRPPYDPDFEVAHGVAVDEVARTLEAHPDAAAVVVVSPTYFGVSSDLPALVDLCHGKNLPLHVDEAWAPHFKFHPALPPSAMEAGADSAVTSIHKLLSGFTQSALLNLQGPRVDKNDTARWLSLLQTTSPSALILASIDGARRQMVLQGEDLLARTIALGNMARERINLIPGLRAIGLEVLRQPSVAGFDLTKLVIDVRETGMTGYDVEAWLRARHRISVEMSDHRRIVALLTIADTEESVERLLTALALVPTELHPSQARPFDAAYDPAALEAESVLTPTEAYHAYTRFVPLSQAAGEITADVLTPYPPGIPLVAPGERFTPNIVDYLRAGLAAGIHVRGASDPTMETVRVVRDA